MDYVYCVQTILNQKRQIKILKQSQEPEVSGIIRNLVGNNLTLVLSVCAPCLNKAKSFYEFQWQVSAALKVFKDTCRRKHLHNDSPKSISKYVPLQDIENTWIPKKVKHSEFPCLF